MSHDTSCSATEGLSCSVEPDVELNDSNLRGCSSPKREEYPANKLRPSASTITAIAPSIESLSRKSNSNQGFATSLSATAVGALVGSCFSPGVGSVVGAVIGVLVEELYLKKVTDENEMNGQTLREWMKNWVK